MGNDSADELEVVSTCNLCGSGEIGDVYPSSWVRRCSTCGYVFRSPRPTHHAISRFYSRDGKYAHWLNEMQGREPCWRHRLAQLRRFVKSGRLLDVGAGIGEFLSHANNFFDGIGTEVSDEAFRLARNLFGITVLKGTRAELPKLEPGSFDAISLIHVLEHSPTRPTRLHSAGGSCGLVVGCSLQYQTTLPSVGTRLTGVAGRTFRRVTRRNAPNVAYSETPPFVSVDLGIADALAEIHLSHFSPECLRDFLSRSGFDVVYMGEIPATPQPGSSASKTVSIFDFGACCTCCSVLLLPDGLFCGALAYSMRCHLVERRFAQSDTVPIEPLTAGNTAGELPRSSCPPFRWPRLSGQACAEHRQHAVRRRGRAAAH